MGTFSTNVIFDEMSRKPDIHFIKKTLFWKLRARCISGRVKGTGAIGVCSMRNKDTYFLGTLINNPGGGGSVRHV